jgi:hypothetical protein
MANKKMIILMVVCFLIAGIPGRSQPPSPTALPKWEKGMTREEYREKIKQSREEYRNQILRRSEKEMDLMAREAWKRLLRVTEQQWKTIEPKHEKNSALRNESRAYALGGGIRNRQSFHWHKYSKSDGGMSARTPDEMTEGMKAVDELIALLEDEKSTDEAIRLKIDAIKKARENAWKQLPKAKEDLAKVLTTPRQEAVFLLVGAID